MVDALLLFEVYVPVEWAGVVMGGLQCDATPLRGANRGQVHIIGLRPVVVVLTPPIEVNLHLAIVTHIGDSSNTPQAGVLTVSCLQSVPDLKRGGGHDSDIEAIWGGVGGRPLEHNRPFSRPVGDAKSPWMRYIGVYGPGMARGEGLIVRHFVALEVQPQHTHPLPAFVPERDGL